MLRVFVVGSPRSGTTLLQRLLAAHPSLTSFPETHFFHALCGEAWLGRRLRLARRKEARQRLLAFLDEAGEQVFRGQVEAAQGRFYGSWISLFISLLDEIAEGRGVEGWIEKTPMHLHYVDVIQAYVPGVRFVHILRRGEDVVASVRRVTSQHPEAWGGERSVEQCLDRWLFDVEQHRRHLGGPEHCFLRYEEMARAPEAALRRVCDFLGLAYADKMLEVGPERGIVLPEEPWKAGAAETVSPEAATTVPEEILDSAELRRVRERVASVDLSAFP